MHTKLFLLLKKPDIVGLTFLLTFVAIVNYSKSNSTLHKALLSSEQDFYTIKNSDMFSWISDLIEQYKNFLNTLSSDQIVAIFNIICHSTIFVNLMTISSVLLSDYLIKYLNLEAKYPKLAKYLKIRENINKHYLMYNFVFIYLFTFFAISANIYMFFLKSLYNT